MVERVVIAQTRIHLMVVRLVVQPVVAAQEEQELLPQRVMRVVILRLRVLLAVLEPLEIPVEVEAVLVKQVLTVLQAMPGEMVAMVYLPQ